MKIIFLGTGAGIPSKERNVTSIALHMAQELNSTWLFDCGEGTQHQILCTSIKPGKINKVFITHLHGDHIFGLPGFLSSRSFQGGKDELQLFGPPGIKQYIETSLQLSESHLTYPLTIVEIEEGKIYEDANVTVFAKKLEHGIPSYGFRIEEKDKLGELQVDKLMEIGIPPGPIYQKIKNNDVTIAPDGQELHRHQFLGPNKPGRVITILGDTRFNKAFQSFIRNSDLLVHEATFSEEQVLLAKNYYHSTTAQAAQTAKDAGVKKLILTHISSRFQKEDYPRLLDEAKAIFPNTELASDFLMLDIPLIKGVDEID
ncbi:ribonuclease Z [Virgibacillus sp. LDC-1]|uniref:ribonuclease Z n=1 Tax=Virgibacillus sp. LDC-1 TaxID=3039856 RepID=UPI0024DE43C0|nr:ribonuclease Z [Virgibacillus sp. LDC-1]